MLKRKLMVGLALGLCAATFLSCGGGNGPTIKPIERGALYTFLGDTPVSDVLSFRANVTAITLKQTGVDNTVTVCPASASALCRKQVDFAALRDFSTILDLASVAAVDYERVDLGISSGQLVVYDPTSDPPIKKIPVKLSTSTPQIPIQPGFSLVKNQVNALRLDLDMLRSIQVDAEGQVTGDVTPTFKATPVVASDTQGFGVFDDLVGFVRSVQPFPIGGNFIGSINLQLLAGSGPALSVNFVSTTQLYGVAALNLLETGRVAEVGAMIDKNGNVVADVVELEDRAVVEEKKLAFLGVVLSVAKDDAGNVTQFRFYVREEEPDVSTTVPLDSVVTVNVLPETTMQFSARPTNFDPALPFDAKAITVGQELIVNGVYTVVTDQPTTVDASSIFLKLQTIQGSLSSIAQLGNDGRSGAFWLAPDATLLAGSPILVFANSNTAYLNLLGLADITPRATLLVRGLPFYQTGATTINGVAIPAGTLVVKARQIHQLD